jgi:hypothetical protein
MSNLSERKDSDRRGFLRKIVSLAASASIVGLLLDRLSDKSVLQPVQANGGTSGGALIIDASGAGSNTGTGTTQLNSSGSPALIAANTGSGAALEGSCTAGAGVLGTTTIGTGVQGTASAATGVAVGGFAGDPGAIPIVAQGAASQSANLQEWRGSSGALSVVDNTGNLGVGTAPAAPLHLYAAVPTLTIAEADGATPSVFQLDTYSNGGSATSGGGFLGRFARGSKASPANVAVGDRLGFTVMGGYAGGAFRHVAAIEGIVDSGTVSDTSLPSAIRFLTTPTGSFARQEVMRINNAGRVGIGTTSPGHTLHVNAGSSTAIRIDGATSATASSGTGTLPSRPVGFLVVNVGGTDRKIPYYA